MWSKWIRSLKSNSHPGHLVIAVARVKKNKLKSIKNTKHTHGSIKYVYKRHFPLHQSFPSTLYSGVKFKRTQNLVLLNGSSK